MPIASVSFFLMSLPIIAFVCLWCLVTLSETQDWRYGFLKAAVLWGSITLLITELLSVFVAVRPTVVALAWAVVVVSSLHLIRRRSSDRKTSLLVGARKLFALPAGNRLWIVPLVPAIVIALTMAVIALVAPPNNWDSMVYHMSRVEHWRANQSVAHYPTNVEFEIYQNPWAEFAILQFQTLGFGSDRLANLVQWFAFVGSMVGASLLVRILGGTSFTQSLAALIVATIPMIVLQSTSTQNDLVCGFFVVAAVCFLFDRLATSSNKRELYLPLSVGLAIATKGTAYVILPPFIAYALISVSKREDLRRGIGLAVMLTIATLLLNAGHWARNLELWHHPLGDPHWLMQHRNASFGIRETWSNIVRNAALHAVTPSTKVNAFAESSVRRGHESLGIDVFEPSLTLPRDMGRNTQVVPDKQFLTHEDYAGNGLALILSVVAIGLAFLTKTAPQVRALALLVLISSVLFCVLFKWTLFNGRLHTPLFLLAAAVVACVVAPLRLGNRHSSELGNNRAALLGIGLGSILTLASLPWIAFNQIRPLISSHDAPSIFQRSRIEQMFANQPEYVVPYSELISVLSQRASCREIGLKIQSGAFEYPLWQIARHAGVNLAFRHVGVVNESAKIQNRSADDSPCAIAVISAREDWNPDLSSFKDMHVIWSRPPIRLLAR